MGMTRAKYTLEFKQEAVRQVKAGRAASAVATTLGMPKASLTNWVRADAKGQLEVRSEGKATTLTVTPEQAEIARLKAHLIGEGLWDEERHAAMDLELAELVKFAGKEAEKNGILGHGMHQPFETMFEDVFEDMPWHLQEQCAQAISERDRKWQKK